MVTPLFSNGRQSVGGKRSATKLFCGLQNKLTNITVPDLAAAAATNHGDNQSK